MTSRILLAAVLLTFSVQSLSYASLPYWEALSQTDRQQLAVKVEELSEEKRKQQEGYGGMRAWFKIRLTPEGMGLVINGLLHNFKVTGGEKGITLPALVKLISVGPQPPAPINETTVLSYLNILVKAGMLEDKVITNDRHRIWIPALSPLMRAYCIVNQRNIIQPHKNNFAEEDRFRDALLRGELPAYGDPTEIAEILAELNAEKENTPPTPPLTPALSMTESVKQNVSDYVVEEVVPMEIASDGEAFDVYEDSDDGTE